MQLISKTSTKKTFAHTWYVYPIVGTLLTLLWIWSFQAFHQPSTHQKLNMFFATEIRNEKFINNILEKYAKEDLREITPSYCLPSKGTTYESKLNLALNVQNNTDILVLDDVSLYSFRNVYSSFFLEMSPTIQSKYLTADDSYYKFDDKDFGVLLKKKGEDHYLKQYMDFEEDRDYYIVISSASKNIGEALGENNAHYDNALSVMKYLISENR